MQNSAEQIVDQILVIDAQSGHLEAFERLVARWQKRLWSHAYNMTGRPEAARAAFLATRARGAAVLIGIPRADAEVSLPALSIPRLERRVLGSIYGSSRPERDFPEILDLYRRGRLPLDRLISHRLPLEAVEEAFQLMTSGQALRVVLDLNGGSA